MARPLAPSHSAGECQGIRAKSGDLALPLAFLDLLRLVFRLHEVNTMKVDTGEALPDRSVKEVEEIIQIVEASDVE